MGFLKDGCFVDGTLSKVHPSAIVPNMILGEADWFKPELKNIGYALNNVWEEYNTWVQKSKKQGEYSRKEFSFDSMKNQIKDIFDKNLTKLPKKMDLNIGNIKMPKKPKLKKV